MLCVSEPLTMSTSLPIMRWKREDVRRYAPAIWPICFFAVDVRPRHTHKNLASHNHRPSQVSIQPAHLLACTA